MGMLMHKHLTAQSVFAAPEAVADEPKEEPKAAEPKKESKKKKQAE